MKQVLEAINKSMNFLIYLPIWRHFKILVVNHNNSLSMQKLRVPEYEKIGATELDAWLLVKWEVLGENSFLVFQLCFSIYNHRYVCSRNFVG